MGRNSGLSATLRSPFGGAPEYNVAYNFTYDPLGRLSGNNGLSYTYDEIGYD